MRLGGGGVGSGSLAGGGMGAAIDPRRGRGLLRRSGSLRALRRRAPRRLAACLRQLAACLRQLAACYRFLFLLYAWWILTKKKLAALKGQRQTLLHHHPSTCPPRSARIWLLQKCNALRFSSRVPLVAHRLTAKCSFLLVGRPSLSHLSRPWARLWPPHVLPRASLRPLTWTTRQCTFGGIQGTACLWLLPPARHQLHLQVHTSGGACPLDSSQAVFLDSQLGARSTVFNGMSGPTRTSHPKRSTVLRTSKT